MDSNKDEDEDKYVEVFDILLWVIFVNWRVLVEICWLKGENYLCKI